MLGFICRQGPLRLKVENDVSILKLFKEQRSFLQRVQPSPFSAILPQLKPVCFPLCSTQTAWTALENWTDECFIFQTLYSSVYQLAKYSKGLHLAATTSLMPRSKCLGWCGVAAHCVPCKDSHWVTPSPLYYLLWVVLCRALSTPHSILSRVWNAHVLLSRSFGSQSRIDNI